MTGGERGREEEEEAMGGAGGSELELEEVVLLLVVLMEEVGIEEEWPFMLSKEEEGVKEGVVAEADVEGRIRFDGGG